MSSETFVDATYRGLDLGRRLRLTEVGPTTAYLEHGAPMPVGSRLELMADGGVALPVDVIRVVEPVAGVERPGMRVRVGDASERAASLWRSLVSQTDPVAPRVVVVAQPADTVDPTAATVAIPIAAEAKRTEIMSAVDVASITATADEVGESSASQSVTDVGEASASQSTDGAGKKKRGAGKGGGRKRK